MAKLTKMGLGFSTKLLAIYGAGIGLFLGVLYSVGGFLIDALVSLGWISSLETPGLSAGTALAFLALIGMPLIFAMLGAMIGLIGAPIYNAWAKRFGGIEVGMVTE